MDPQQLPLMSWKEIAAYLGKSVRTAQRWQYEFALPVEHLGKRHMVCALPGEVQHWLQRWSPRHNESALNRQVELSIAASQQLRSVRRQLMAKIHFRLQMLVGECEALARQLRPNAKPSDEESLNITRSFCECIGPCALGRTSFLLVRSSRVRACSR